MTLSRRQLTALAELFDYCGMPEGALRDLRRRMGAPGRHYHGLQHLADLWLLHRRFGRHSRFRTRSAERLIARVIAFHDAICDPRRDDNEPQSAALWRRLARTGTRMPRGAVERVAQAIEATGRHASGAVAGPGNDLVLHWVLDLDLASIGAPAHRFRRNTSRLRAESIFLPAAEWDRSRLGFLGALAARSTLYHSRRIAAGFEAMARANLARELSEGEGASAPGDGSLLPPSLAAGPA